MRYLTRVLALCLLTAAPLGAQEEPAPASPGDDGSASEGFDLLERGARMLFDSMMGEVEPTLKDLNQELGTAMQDLGPMLGELAAMIGDIRNYDAPEKLPNGDIIIRRKAPGPVPDLPPASGDNPEIEL